MSTNALEQRTDDWYMARVGHITGSRVGAVFGNSPWQSRKDVLRQMVSEALNGPDKSAPTAAMQWGIDNEERAAASYEFLFLNDEVMEKTGFWRKEWEGIPLGASPDRLIGDEGLLEIKCPYTIRNDVTPHFKSISMMPHYEDQVLMQLYVTGRKWCDFFQWTPHGTKLERVWADEMWTDKFGHKLKEFYADYLKKLEDVREGGAMQKTALMAQWMAAAEDFLMAKSSKERYEQEENNARERLVRLCKDANLDECMGSGVHVQRVLRKGTVDYKAIVQEKVENYEDFEDDYRRESSASWRITEEAE